MIGRKIARCDRGIAALEFALLAPALLMLVFGVLIYSLYFTALLGVRQAASEGARAAMAGLNTAERSALAKQQADAVIQNYGWLMKGATPVVSSAAMGTSGFRVTVTYDISSSPIMQYSALLPLPSSNVTGSAVVSNGSY